MRALMIPLLLVVPVALGSLGCGGNTAYDSDAGVSGTGGHGTGTGGASATGGATSVSCDVITSTAAQVGLCEAASACAKTECKPALAKCMGANYESGVYAGKTCSDYANCVKSCNCVQSCMSANCALSQACADCLNTDLLYAVIQSDNCAAIAYRCLTGN